MAVMIRRALDTLPSVVEGFLCRETDVSYVLKPDTTVSADPCCSYSQPIRMHGRYVLRRR
jgi:hypothetical protein